MELKYKAPSRDIGEKFNLPFLWNDWGLGDRHEELQDKYLNDDEATYLELCRHIYRTEPRFLDLRNLNWVIMGVLSQYNFDDIWYFCTVHPFERDPAVYEAQEAMNWGGNGWVMSPETLALVRQVKAAA